jgi:FkbM family methyltransferase
MSNILLSIRKRYHPLFHLRKFYSFQSLTRWFDTPVGIKVPFVSHPIYVSLSKNLSLVLSAGEAGEENERANFIGLVKRAQFARFFDVGANVGIYGFTFHAVAANDATVVLFEPDAGNSSLIRKTISRSSLSGVELVQAAVSDSQGIATFYKDDISGATGSVELGAKQDGFVTVYHRAAPTKVMVQSVTLDQVTKDDPDLLKIDVEGAELRVLKGAKELISRSAPALFFECDRNQASVHSFLSAHGYIFFDFSSMQRVETIPHNCLALHKVKHAAILSELR